MPPEGLNCEKINAFLKFLAMNSISKESSRLASFRPKPFISSHLGEAQFGSENARYYSHHRDLSALLLDLTLLLLGFLLSYIAHADRCQTEN